MVPQSMSRFAGSGFHFPWPLTKTPLPSGKTPHSDTPTGGADFHHVQRVRTDGARQRPNGPHRPLLQRASRVHPLVLAPCRCARNGLSEKRMGRQVVRLCPLGNSPFWAERETKAQPPFWGCALKKEKTHPGKDFGLQTAPLQNPRPAGRGGRSFRREASCRGRKLG